MTTKPKPGERVCEYLERCAAEALRRAGASETETADFADTLVVWFGNDCRTLRTADVAVLLNDWRVDRAEQAAICRAARRARLDAGYFGQDVSDPVYLNGSTAW